MNLLQRESVVNPGATKTGGNVVLYILLQVCNVLLPSKGLTCKHIDAPIGIVDETTTLI